MIEPFGLKTLLASFHFFFKLEGFLFLLWLIPAGSQNFKWQVDQPEISPVSELQATHCFYQAVNFTQLSPLQNPGILR